MSDRTDVLCQQLLQKNSSACTVEELQQMANDYPYFAPVQILLAEKLAALQSPDFMQQKQKAILYYPDPFRYNLFFSSEKYTADFSVADDVPFRIQEEVDESQKPYSHAWPEYPEEEKVSEMAPTESALEKENKEEVVDYDPVLAGEDVLDDNMPAPAHMPATADLGMAFEPFHTVDYFASQGIKLSQEENTQDRFGKQLKSFTDWIKSMRRLSQTEQEHQLHTSLRVENEAAHSVEDTNIYTETMADVWAKQGNTEKAIEIYNKLSLQNPSKIAYFAAKIDSLKKA